jgi:hypothetical protein
MSSFIMVPKPYRHRAYKPEDGNSKKYSTAQQTQVHLRLSSGSVHGSYCIVYVSIIFMH